MPDRTADARLHASFHLGTPILAMLGIAIVCGTLILLRPSSSPASIRVWLYGPEHRETYESILPAFQQQTGLSLRLDLLSQRSLNTRLLSVFMSGSRTGDLPDLVELEVDDVAKYLRPPAAEVGLLPLDDYLKQSGYSGRIVPSRLAPWVRQGQLFGIPRDVHPVTLTYRKDLWDQAGIDPQWVTDSGSHRPPDWHEFQQKCLDFQAYWTSHGQRNRHAIELFSSQPAMLAVLLRQRHVNVVDAGGHLHLCDPKTVQTLAFYAQVVAGPRQIAGEAAAGVEAWAADISAGNLCCFLSPDWRVADLRHAAPQLAGKLRMMPLPRLSPDDAPTSTWGGTMIGIPRSCPRPDDAWKAIEFLYLSDTGRNAIATHNRILPAVRDSQGGWSLPALHEPDPYFGGQKVDELYIDLADQTPAEEQNWAAILARGGLGYVLNQATAYLNAGRPADGLEPYVAAQLQWISGYIQRCIDHGTVE